MYGGHHVGGEREIVSGAERTMLIATVLVM